MRALALGIGLAVLASAPALADSIVITADRDNTLYESETGELSNGQGFWLFAGRTGGGVGGGDTRTVRSLVHFDLSGIPEGATIDGVTLSLEVDTPMSRAGRVDVHGVLADWGEGTSDALQGEAGGAQAAAGDATWIHTFFSGSTWTNPGGDFDAAASATLFINGNGPAMWTTTPELVADVQAWLDDPSQNFGWMLRNANESASALRFASADFPDPATRPLLFVEFTPVPEPSSAALALFAGAGALAMRRPGR